MIQALDVQALAVTGPRREAGQSALLQLNQRVLVLVMFAGIAKRKGTWTQTP